jgi:hypothetical protein
MITLADAIIAEDIHQVSEILQKNPSVNVIDEYGFTPLIEAAIADNKDIAALLIDYGADVNAQDMTGGTALHWATENNNLPLCQLLLEHQADANAYNFSGQPILTIAVLRQQAPLKTLLMRYGASLEFAQDFINTKQLGHLFELIGTANIVSPANQFVEIDFEGFFLEVTVGLIADSLFQFKNHFAARQLRRDEPFGQLIINNLLRAARLLKFQQYRVNLPKHAPEIKSLMHYEPLIIPVGYEGHAITFIKFSNMLIKCDRRESSRLYDNIVVYRVNRLEQLTQAFIQNLMYEKMSTDAINDWLPEILALEPITTLQIPAQVSGNCSWANVEACIPAVYFLLASQYTDFKQNMSHYKSLALRYFNQWQEWNRDRTLNLCLQQMQHIDSIRKACKAEILGAILFQRCNNTEIVNQARIDSILYRLTQPEFDYILQNYIQTYCYKTQENEGKDFLRLLKNYGYPIK